MRRSSFVLAPLLATLLAACAGTKKDGAGAEAIPLSGAAAGGAAAGGLGPAQPVPAVHKALEVAHVSPKGALEDPPRQVVVMFNQPMVAIADVAEQNARMPVSIEPPVAVRGHWVGTRIAVLTPVEPLRPATAYKVRVPAGTPSVSGAALAADAVAEFETPRPAVTRVWPDQGHDDCDADQVFVVELNQPVAPSRLEPATTFRLARGTPIRAKVWAPSREEVRLSRQRLGAWFLNDGAVERGTMFLVRPARPLPLDSAFALRVESGLVGREGPLPSAVAASREYRTYGPLKVVGTGCAASCTPDQPWEASLRFSNPVGSLEFRRKVMRLRDDRDDGPGWYSHEHRALERPVAGRDYEAVVPADLTDSHGQSLGREVRVRYSFGHWPPQFEDWGSGGVMESDGPRRYAFAVRNVSRVLADVAPVPLDRAARVLSALAEGTPDLKGLGLNPAAVTIGVSAPLDASTVAAMDLSPALGGGRTGIVAYRARAEAAGRGELSTVHAGAVQVTDLALTAKASPETIVLWVTRLSTGEPQGGVAVEVRADDDTVLWSGSTAPDGRAEAPGTDALSLRLPPPPKKEARIGEGSGGEDGDEEEEDGGWEPEADPVQSRLFAVARAGVDATVLRLSDARLVWAETPSVEGDAYEEGSGSDERWRSVVVTDRDLYREGETVRMKGWVRRMTGRGPLRVPGGTATLEVFPPQEDEDPPGPVARTPVFFDDWGSFSVSWQVPAGARHGPYAVRIELPGEDATHAASFQVTFFEPPEFSVTATLDRPEYVRGDVAGASIRAAYYFGAPMAEAPVTYSFYTSPTSFEPPGQTGFRFHDPFDSDAPPTTVSPDERLSGEGDGTLDAAGTGAREHRLLPATRSPATVTFEAEVEDTSGRNVSGRATAIVHPAEFYLGTRLESWLVDAGTATEVGVAAVDPRGKPVPVPSVSVSVTRREWQTVRRKGVGDTWQVISEPVDVAVETREVEIRDGRGAYRLTPPVPGLYRVRASASDVRGNPVRAGASFYAVGPGYAAWRRSSDSRVQLMPDKGSYAPGETARIQVHSPYEKGTALVTVERQGVLWQRVIAMKGNAEAFELPILPEYEPNVTVGVVVARGRLPSPPGAEPDPDDLGAPSVRVGAVRLRVDPGENRLAVAVKPAVPEVRPGQDVEVGVEVRDRSGRGTRAQVLVFAVDAAVLDLSGYSPADPFDTFFAPIGASVVTGDSRDFLIRRILLGEKSEPGGDGGGDLTRKDFVALAFWDPEVVTGDDGRATVRFRAPDNLTRFRVFAVATSGEARFGLARTEFTVNRPLVVRPALPPFAETRDAFRMAVAVHGAPGATGEAIVKVEATGSVSLRGASEARVAVGEGRVREALFELVAGEAGEGTVRVSGQLGQERDAVQLKVPVRRRVRTETVATSGSATAQVSETVEPPAGAAPDVGGLAVSVAPTALVGLDRAAKSLISYPYGCLEQRMSAILPDLYLEDLAATFGFAPGTEGDLRESVRKTLARLREFQRPDGGFGFWAGGSDASDPYLTAWTIRIAGIARERGFKADPGVIADAVAFLEKSLRTPRDASRDRPPDPDQAAFAAFVLAEEGRTVGDLVTLLVAKRQDLSRTGRAWLAAAAWKDGAAAAALDLMTEVLEGATVKGDEAELPVPRGDEWHGMASGDVALTAAALIAGARAVPTHPLLPRLAAHLWAARRNGEWSGTHENGLALMALATWIRTSEGDAAPDLAVSPWLGATPLATWEFESRSAPPRATDVPMRRLIEAGRTTLAFAVRGSGTYHWSAALTYAPAGQVPARDQGVWVRRRVLSVADAADLASARRGQIVVVSVTIAGPTPLDRLAIDVPVPAGLVPVNFDFQTASERLRRAVDALPWEGDEVACAHTSIRDDRVTCFVDRLPAGLHVHRFAARAVVPGRFAFPPATAEEMYHPETFGTSDAAGFVVE